MEYDLDSEYRKFKDDAKSKNLELNWSIIDKTFQFAKDAHSSQKRWSGLPYISHPLAVAKILLDYNPDTTTIQSALLHDVCEDTSYNVEDIEKEFGKSVSSIVDALTKIEHTPVMTMKQAKAESIRKMIMTLSRDIRIILIKLGDRLHNMRTLKYMPKENQERFAKETLEIYTAIAHKLNLTKIKNELEDLVLEALAPEDFKKIKEGMNKKRAANTEEIEEIRKTIEKELKTRGIDVTVMGRTKHYFSIFKKLKKKHIPFEDLMDLMAFRVITKTIQDCYKVLGVLLEIYEPIPNTLDDYISTPKPNMYQSIHINLTKDKHVIEVQIRTEEMHRIAESGIAAHWAYKGHEQEGYEKKMEWMKSLLDWQKEVTEASEFVEGLKIEFFERGIVVFTPKGDMVELPEGSTGIDFAFSLHTSIGLHLDKIKANDKIVPLSHVLNDGDIVEVIVSNKVKVHSNWLHQVKTRKAKSRIRAALHLEGKTSKSKTNIVEAPIESEGVEKSKIIDGILHVRQGSTNTKLSGCCNPKPKDPISSFYSKDKYSIHKINCEELLAAKDKSLIKAVWDAPKGNYLIRVGIVGIDRPTLLAEILKAVVPSKLTIEKMKVKITRDDRALVDFILRLNTLEEFETLREELKKIDGVKEVYRTSIV